MRIWSDCQSVVERTSLLLEGKRRIKPNSANADMWSLLQQAAIDLGCHNITLVKVAAHEEPSDADTEFDRWCKFNNSCADAAAKAANSNRSPFIWDLWEQHSGEVVGLQQLGRKLLQYHLDVCRRWTDDDATGQIVSCKEPRVAPTPELVFHVVAPPNPLPQGIQTCLGSQYSQKLVQWWQAWVEPEARPSGWISFAQCFIHFQLWTRHPGAIRVCRRWIDPDHEPLTLPETYSFRTRCRWFRLQLQTLWKSLGWHVATCTTRPVSDFLPCHIGCGAIPVKQETWSQVEAWLGRKTTEPISGHGEALDLLPLVW